MKELADVEAILILLISPGKFGNRKSPIKAAAIPSGWLYEPKTLSEVSMTPERFCIVGI
jgi:hypothetical protein